MPTLCVALVLENLLLVRVLYPYSWSQQPRTQAVEMSQNALATVQDSAQELAELPPELVEGLEAAAELADAAVAPSTRSTYDRAFRRFEVWAGGHGLSALPATRATVAAYMGLLHRRLLTPSRIGVVMSAIAWHHQRAGLPNPTLDDRLKLAMKGARRKDAARPRRKAHAILAKDPGGLPGELHRLASAVEGGDLVALRDRAVILLGFAGAFRRSELAALTLGDLEWDARGVSAHVRRAKNDQMGKGLVKAIVPGQVNCPVQALGSWLMALEEATRREKAAGKEGRRGLPVFVGFARPRREERNGDVVEVPVPKETAMSDQTVNLILKRYAGAAGLDPDALSGHSLRRGLVTSAALEGADINAIRSLTGHNDLNSLGKYMALVWAFENSPARGLL